MKLKLIFIIGLFLFQSKAKDDRSPIAIDIKVEREYEVTKVRIITFLIFLTIITWLKPIRLSKSILISV